MTWRMNDRRVAKTVNSGGRHHRQQPLHSRHQRTKRRTRRL